MRNTEKSNIGRALTFSAITKPIRLTMAMPRIDSAVGLAKPLGAAIELLHVLDPIYASGRFNAPRLRRFHRATVRDTKRRLTNVAR